MATKKTRGRQKIEMKKVERLEDRLITFSKRRAGIYKKASELVTMCGAEVAILVYSPGGKPFSYGHPSFETVLNRFLDQNPPPRDNTHLLVEAHRQVRVSELTKYYNELIDQFEAEKEKAKLQKQIQEEAKGTPWWEIPVEDVENADELMQMYNSYAVILTNLCTKINEKCIGGFEEFMAAAASSSKDFFPPIRPLPPATPLTQAATPFFAPNPNQPGPSNFSGSFSNSNLPQSSSFTGGFGAQGTE